MLCISFPAFHFLHQSLSWFWRYVIQETNLFLVDPWTASYNDAGIWSKVSGIHYTVTFLHKLQQNLCVPIFVSSFYIFHPVSRRISCRSFTTQLCMLSFLLRTPLSFLVPILVPYLAHISHSPSIYLWHSPSRRVLLLSQQAREVDFPRLVRCIPYPTKGVF